MGRYYNGDIEGKFWFAVQDSDDADFFGSTGYQPERLEYYFEKEEHLESIKEGVATCKEKLGDWKQKLDDFFKKVNGYNDQIMQDNGLDPKVAKGMLVWYARLELGEKILACVEEQGECTFEAEC